MINTRPHNYNKTNDKNTNDSDYNDINNKILNVLDGNAKRVRERETRSLFNKNVMLAPCVTPSIHCCVLSVYFVCLLLLLVVSL